MRIVVAVSAGLLLVAACGSQDDRREAAGPLPRLQASRVEGPIPGRPIDGSFSDEHGRPVTDVHVLATVGKGRRRVDLLFGRRDAVACLGARAHGTDQRLDCLERWENPPVLARVVVGGDVRARTDWLAVVGVVRKPAASVSMRPQSGSPEPVPLRSWPGFEWSAFSVMTDDGNFANALPVTDADGEVVTVVDPSWAYDALTATGPWAEVRDPIAAASGADDTAHPLAFSHPAVVRLVHGHTYVLNPTSDWVKCNGESLGAVVSMRLHPPVDFQGEIPIHDYAREDENVAYRSGRAYVEATGVTVVEAWVDLNRKRVIGVNLQAFDDAQLEERDSPTEIEEWDVLEEPKPAGGPDDSEACPEHEIGD